MTEATPTSFGERMTAAFDRFGQLCVGIDPHSWLLGEWNLPDTAAGAREFGLRVVDAAFDRVGMIKPQIAFFERYGSKGYQAIEEIFAQARAAGLMIIADVKRGDVGTSVEAYGQAWLEPAAPLEADAMTASAYQGVGSLAAPLRLAHTHGKGVFVLSATSNPEAADIQTAVTSTDDGGANVTIAAVIADTIAERNRATTPGGVGSAGLVLGATIDLARFGIDRDMLVGTPILAPGFGHQGARYDELNRLYGPAAATVVVAVSRSILAEGPSRLAETIRTEAQAVADCRA